MKESKILVLSCLFWLSPSCVFAMSAQGEGKSTETKVEGQTLVPSPGIQVPELPGPIQLKDQLIFFLAELPVFSHVSRNLIEIVADYSQCPTQVIAGRGFFTCRDGNQ